MKMNGIAHKDAQNSFKLNNKSKMIKYNNKIHLRIKVKQ